MALKLEDLINKKKEPNAILDLSKIKIKSAAELEKYLDKVPELKIRPEKLRPEDVRVRETEFSWKPGRKEKNRKEFPYSDPCPSSMRSVRLEDLAAVDISWRMLTNLRPNNRLEEDIFGRLVELGKLRLATRDWEAKQLANAATGAPGSQAAALAASIGILTFKTKRGATETRIKICPLCGLELCTGVYCKEFPYDSYTRLMVDKDEVEGEDGDGGTEKRRQSKSKAHHDKNKPLKGKVGAKRGKKKRKKKKKVQERKSTSPELSN